MKILPSFIRILVPIALAAVFLCTACTRKSNSNIPENPTTVPAITLSPALLTSQPLSPQTTVTPSQLPVPTQPPTVTPLTKIPPDPDANTLRAYASQRGKLIGAAVNNGLVREEKYAEVLAREYNLLTTENAMKWSLIQPEQNRYDWADADELVNFAIAHEMKVRGHTLIWQQQMPDWLKYGEWTRDELLAIMEEHITNVVGRYRGRVYIWDVVNEAVINNGKITTPFWYNRLGSDYVDIAFQTAHEADPDALLFYNDYNAEDMHGKSNAVYQMVNGMKERGIPIDGVGMQFHVELNKIPDLDQVALNIKRLGDLGLQVHITELDIHIKNPPTQEQLEQQAQNYRDILNICLDAPNCTAFIMWGMTDKYSWVPIYKEGYGSALIFDENYEPKPAFLALLEALKRK